jgi:prephenate dehydrogenase
VTVGLIGYGRFGKLAAALLSRRVRVLVADRRRPVLRGVSANIAAGTIAEAASQEVVILAVPVSTLRSLLLQIKRHVRPGALIIDVCAVKEKPTRWMRTILPPTVEILGAHPLFGPDSCDGSLKGHTVVLCPVRVGRRRLVVLKQALTREHARAIIMPPDRHDRMIAETIFLTQYIGRLIGKAGLDRWEGVTVHYDRLRSVVDAAVHDSPRLFADMWKYNAYGARVSAALRKAQGAILRQLEKGQM